MFSPPAQTKHIPCSRGELVASVLRGGRDRSRHQTAAVSMQPWGGLGAGWIPATAGKPCMGTQAWAALQLLPRSSQSASMSTCASTKWRREWVAVSFNLSYKLDSCMCSFTHMNKSMWVIKNIVHCLPKTILMGARAPGCSASSLRLLTSAYKPALIFIHWDLSACILNACYKATQQKQRIWEAPLSQKIIFVYKCLQKTEMNEILQHNWKLRASVGKQTEQYPEPSCSTASSLHLMRRQNAASPSLNHTSRGYNHLSENTERNIKWDRRRQPARFHFKLTAWRSKGQLQVSSSSAVTMCWIKLLSPRLDLEILNILCYNLSL